MKTTLKLKLLLLFIIIMSVVLILTKMDFHKKQEQVKNILENQKVENEIENCEAEIKCNEPDNKNIIKSYSSKSITQESVDQYVGDFDMPLPLPTVLSQEDFKEAISIFEDNHRSWCAIRDIKANYKVYVRNYDTKTGSFEEEPVHAGTIEFASQPLNEPQHGNFIQVPFRLQSDTYKWSFVKDNICDTQTPPKAWKTESENFVEPEKWVKYIYKGFPIDEIVLPLRQMNNAYTEEEGKRTIQIKKHEFFADKGIPLCKSKEKETAVLFNGEQQYLFCPIDYNWRFGLSCEKGEFRSIDSVKPLKGFNRVLRYENYIEEKDGEAKIPTRYVIEWRNNDNKMVKQTIVELDNVKINSELPKDFFSPRKNAVSIHVKK